jgi:hypothetical protein
MAKGQRKRGEFDFTIWFEDGSRVQWQSNRSQTNADLALVIRKYLVPVAERLEAQDEAAHLVVDGTTKEAR